MFRLHAKLWQRAFRIFNYPAVILSALLVLLCGISALIRVLVFAETSAVGSLVVTYSEGSNYIDEDIVGKNFNLSVADGKIATLKLKAKFSEGENKKINIKVPTGYVIKSYSATSGTAEMDGVSKVEIDNAYRDYVLTSNLTAATADTHILDKDGNPVKFTSGSDWASQNITGYAKLDSSTGKDQRVYGGDIEYVFADATTEVELVFSIAIDNPVLSHVATTEAMEAIDITMSSSKGMMNQKCHITAAYVQEFHLDNKAFYPGAAAWNIRAESGISNRSEQFAIAAGVLLYSSVSGSVTILDDSLIATITYPEGVYYDNKITLPFIGETITTNSHTGSHDTVTVNEGANGGGTITIDLSKIRIAHASNSLDNHNITAYFRADTAVYNQANPAVNLSINYEYERNGETQTGGLIKYTRTMIFSGAGKDMRILSNNYTLRDNDGEYGYAPFSYYLGSFRFSSALDYNDVKMKFEFENGMGVRAVTVPGSNVHDIIAVTTKGRTINVASVPGKASIHHGAMISETDLGLTDGEYLVSITATIDIAQGSYTGAYTYNSCAYWGHFLNGQAGEARLSILDNTTGSVAVNGTTNQPMTATDQTTIGWTESGAGTYTTTANGTTFYPNSTIEVTSYVFRQSRPYNTTNQINSLVLISLPKGVNLDPTSVKLKSPNGEKGNIEQTLSQVQAPSKQAIDSVEWTTYYYQAENPYDFVVFGDQPFNSNYTSSVSTVTFKAIVDNAVPSYNLSLKDILSYDLGRTAVGAAAYVYPDTHNRSGKTTETEVYNLAAAGGNIQIKPLTGLNIDIGIRTKDMNQDFMTYNGTESSIATVARNKPAEVKVYYESTATSDYKAGSTIYMPIPKKGLDYVKYFENLEVENPMVIDTNNATFEYSAKLGSIPTLTGNDGATWTTYVATNITGSNPVNYVAGNANWEPVIAGSEAVNWTKASDFVAAGNNLKDVVMLKFVADTPITANSKGECIYELLLNDTISRPPNATDYWRTYNLAVTSDDGTGIWNYSSIIAANADGIDLAGQIFVDRNQDAVYDGPDTKYQNNKYSILLSRDDNTEPTRELFIDENGFFSNKAKVGNELTSFFLKQGDYTITITRSDTEDVYVYSKVESQEHSNHINYYNDVKNANINAADKIATLKLSVDVVALSTNNYTANLGIGLVEQGLHLVYEWDGNIPEGVVLPQDGIYTSGDRINVDTTYTKDTSIKLYEPCPSADPCDQVLLGTYYFSGWTTDSNIIETNMIINNATAKGFWRYVPYESESEGPSTPEEPNLPVPNTGASTTESGTSSYRVGVAVMVAFSVSAVTIFMILKRYYNGQGDRT